VYIRAPLIDVFHGDICGLPVAIGSCDEDLERWYWDQLTESCERFLFSGCDGNENNFETEADCSEVCGVELPDLEIDTTEQPVTSPVEDEGRPTFIDAVRTMFYCVSFFAQYFHFSYVITYVIQVGPYLIVITSM